MPRILDVPEKVFGSEPFLVTLGEHVSITGRARFVTHEGGLWDNVFIGLNAIVLPNVTIGSDVIVVAATAVVSRDVLRRRDRRASSRTRSVGDVKTFREKVAPRTVLIRSLPFAQRKRPSWPGLPSDNGGRKPYSHELHGDTGAHTEDRTETHR